MEVFPLSPAVGAAYWRGDAPGDAILFGCFSEVNKWIASRGWSYPHTIVLPEVVLHRRVPQFAPEFLFYGYIFREGNFDFAEKRVIRRLRFVGTEGQLRRIRDILEVSYLGAQPELLSRLGADPTIASHLAREGAYFALKDGRGNVIPLDEYIELLPWHDDRVTIENNTHIAKTDRHTYEVRRGSKRTRIRLAYDGDQPPVWQIPSGMPSVPHRFALQVLGSYDGFDVNGPSTAYLLWIDGRRILVDCAPYADRLLEAQGFSLECIDGIIITHIHEDHTGGLPAFTQSARRLPLWTTPEIWRAVQIKLGAVLDRPAEEISKDFEFHELPIETPYPLFGAAVRAHYSCHSVPTIGLQVQHEGETIIITGDIAGKDYLDRMMHDGALAPERHRALMDYLFRTPGYLVADAGEALIHGYPKDYVMRSRSRLFLSHRSLRPTGVVGHVAVIHPGSTLVLSAGKEEQGNMRAIRSALAQWGVSGRKAASVRRRSIIRDFPAGGVVVAQGDRDLTYVYIIAHGICTVAMDGEPVARLCEGEYFGEAAFLHPAEKRNADVVAVSPVRLACVPGEVFRELLQEPVDHWTVAERLRKILRIRPILQRSPLLVGLPVHQLNSLSLAAEECAVEPGALDVHANDACFFVAEGAVRIHETDGRVLGPYEALGPGLTWPRRAHPPSVHILRPSRLVKLPKRTLFRVIDRSPLVRQRLLQQGAPPPV